MESNLLREGTSMNTASGSNKYIIQAILDIISETETISRDKLTDMLISYGFSESIICIQLDLLNIYAQANIADLSRITEQAQILKPIAITYPAYDNRGIPAKSLYNNSIISILQSFQKIIYEAKKRIIILSPYIEDNGLKYLQDLLISKLQAGVEITIIVRELEEKSNRRDRLIRWIKDNFHGYTNFIIYNYHYVSNNGHIDSTCHAKVIVSDNHIAYIGSADIRSRAFNLNLEMGTIHSGYNARVIAFLMENIIEISTPYKLD